MFHTIQYIGRYKFSKHTDTYYTMAQIYSEFISIKSPIVSLKYPCIKYTLLLKWKNYYYYYYNGRNSFNSWGRFTFLNNNQKKKPLSIAHKMVFITIEKSFFIHINSNKGNNQQHKKTGEFVLRGETTNK